jgi:hypothetical protein
MGCMQTKKDPFFYSLKRSEITGVSMSLRINRQIPRCHLLSIAIFSHSIKLPLTFWPPPSPHFIQNSCASGAKLHTTTKQSTPDHSGTVRVARGHICTQFYKCLGGQGWPDVASVSIGLHDTRCVMQPFTESPCQYEGKQRGEFPQFNHKTLRGSLQYLVT